MEKHPDYVVKRYESGNVATNAECDAIYREALERIDSPRRTPGPYQLRADNMLSSKVPLPRSNLDASHYTVSDNGPRRQPLTGMKGNPVHVVVDEG